MFFIVGLKNFLIWDNYQFDNDSDDIFMIKQKPVTCKKKFLWDTIMQRDVIYVVIIAKLS